MNTSELTVCAVYSTSPVCDRWLDKLGVSAQRGVGVVTRQTFYGYYYSLIDVDMNPNPVSTFVRLVHLFYYMENG